MKQQTQVNFEDTTPIVCDNCGGSVFNQALILRKVSKIIMASAEDGLMPVPTFYCIACNHVNKEFIPQELQELG